MKFNNLNTFISPSAVIGSNVKIGDNTIIYDNVEIGDNTIISNDCVIGEPLSTYYEDPANYSNPKTVIGQDSLIRSHSIIYADSFFGSGFSTGHRVTIREKTIVGINCRVGTLSDIQGHSEFGNYCWLHSNVHIGQNSKIGNFVFIYPYVVFTNDPTPPSNICKGPTIGDYTQIAVGAIILPGVQIGEHCLIGAGAVVGKNIENEMLVLGNPAKEIKSVREIKSRETQTSHYPWPFNFERGMPWQDIGYEKWKNKEF